MRTSKMLKKPSMAFSATPLPRRDSIVTSLIGGALSFVFLLGVEMPSLAHHSWVSDYDGSRAVMVQGVVTKVEWTNPHVHFYIDSRDDEGVLTSWNFEMASVLSLERGGWSRRTLQVGDEITVEGFSGRAVRERAIASSIMTSDGRSLFVGDPAQ